MITLSYIVLAYLSVSVTLLPILLGLWHSEHFGHYDLLMYHHNHPACIPFAPMGLHIFFSNFYALTCS